MRKGLRTYLRDKNTLKNCKIYQMLSVAAGKKHLSFHTPGHKIGRWDITELSFSDNLSAPQGCIAEAEKDIARILGAKGSFILTDGSTSGVLAMLYVAMKAGARTIAVCKDSHKSVFNGCKLLGLTPLIYMQKSRQKIPYPHTMSALKEEYPAVFAAADAVFLTSPDYYGNIADLKGIRDFCREQGKLLLIDGAHGGHLHFNKENYAGAYADLWVDGVHKSLPAFTQGAVVSARTDELTEALRTAVDIFRTTSPSYPIMASVEYAVKYPRNDILEGRVTAFVNAHERIYTNDDWTKLCVRFADKSFAVEKELEQDGIYAEFCDGNVVTFYLSPAMSLRQFERLKKRLLSLFKRYPLDCSQEDEKDVKHEHAPFVLPKNTETEWVELDDAEDRFCACACGLFPPCTPLISIGERIQKSEIALLKSADNVFGLHQKKILVYKNE